jgi:hypothetical protein
MPPTLTSSTGVVEFLTIAAVVAAPTILAYDNMQLRLRAARKFHKDWL